MAATEVTRQEHLDWCKQRAVELADSGDLDQAFASFLSDVSKHAETKSIAELIVKLGIPLKMLGALDTPAKMREHIEGYN